MILAPLRNFGVRAAKTHHPPNNSDLLPQTTFLSMDEPQKHYAKGKTPDMGDRFLLFKMSEKANL